MQDRKTQAGNRCEPYPLFVQLHGEPVAVVGAGDVAARKVQTLLDHGADVTVVAPDAVEPLRAHAAAGRITWVARRYEEGDLAGALFVVCATNDRAVNEAVYAEAHANHQLVNVVDVPDLCNAIVPSILERGRLQIAVSTGGASPTCAREIRRSLERQFPAYWEEYLDLMAELRVLVKERMPGPASARVPVYEALQSSGLFERIAAGETVEAEDEYRRVVAPFVEGGRA